MKPALLAAGLLCLTIPHHAHAEDTCPALNRTQASTALGAEAQLAVEWHAANDYVCDYTAGPSHLHIVIGPYHARQGWPSYSAKCFAAPQPLTGVGNEAVSCADPATHRGEVLAHVTDTLLDVTLTAPAVPSAALQEILRHAAEQVAGNLF